jgi:hypothetical protein
MLKEAMLAMRITDEEYEPEICRLLKAAESDLKIAGVVIDGECVFVITETTDAITGAVAYTITDNSTITDDMVITAMITYCRVHFGSPPDYDKLVASYDLQRRQLANATGYTDFGDEPEPEPEPEPTPEPDGAGEGS